MGKLFALIFSYFAASWFGGFVTAALGLNNAPWMGPLIAFTVAFLLTDGVVKGRKLEGGGWKTSPVVRLAVGQGARALLFLPAMVGLTIVFQTITGKNIWTWTAGTLAVAPFSIDAVMQVAIVSGLSLLTWWGVGHAHGAKAAIAGVLRPFRVIWRALTRGLGGSSEFLGLLDEWERPYTDGAILLGTSMYDPSSWIGIRDDRHMLTIATSRAGKGRSSVIPNLLLWPGSAVVIDPKGQNALVTADRRGGGARDDDGEPGEGDGLGQDVFIIDPFGVLASRGDDRPTHSYNPLDAIDLDAIDVVEQISNLAAALVVASATTNPFWDNAARDLLIGVLAHVLTAPDIADRDRHLGTVRRLTSSWSTALKSMKNNQAIGGLPARAYAEMVSTSQTAQGDIARTLAVHLSWLDSLAMQQAFSRSSHGLDLKSLKAKPMTLYLVIPPDLLKTHARYLRMFITLALRAAGRGVKAEHPMLFVLDEFAALGKLDVIEEAAGVAAGGGVKLWPIVQNLTQLSVYGGNWETFIANTGVIQLFAANDRTTAQYFSERLGEHIAWQRMRVGQEQEWVPNGRTFLRTTTELAEESSRDSGQALIYFEGGRAMLLRRSPYDRLFPPEEYNADPYEPGSRAERARLLARPWLGPARHRVRLTTEHVMQSRWYDPLAKFEAFEDWSQGRIYRWFTGRDLPHYTPPPPLEGPPPEPEPAPATAKAAPDPAPAATEPAPQAAAPDPDPSVIEMGFRPWVPPADEPEPDVAESGHDRQGFEDIAAEMERGLGAAADAPAAAPAKPKPATTRRSTGRPRGRPRKPREGSGAGDAEKPA